MFWIKNWTSSEPLTNIVTGSSLSKELFEEIIESTVNNKSLSIREDYMEWSQWSKPGILTWTGLSAVDKIARDKIYEGIVVNLTEDSVCTMKTLINWENEDMYSLVVTENNLTNEWFKKINIWEIYDDIVSTSLLYGECYTYLYNDLELWTLNIKIYTPEEVYEEDGSYFIVTVKEWSNSLKKTYLIEEYTTDPITKITMHRLYENQYLKWEEIVAINPFFELEAEQYLTDSMLHLQDVLNIKYTKLFEIEKYNTDPLTVVKWIKVNPGDTIETGSWSVVFLPNTDSSIEKVAWQYVDQYFLQELESMKLDYYKQAKLSSIKNSDLSWVTSWYALQLKLIETLSFVNRFRSLLKLSLIQMFAYYANQTNLTIFQVSTIFFAPIIWEKNKEDESKMKKMENIQKKIELTKMLIDSGYTITEAEAYIEKNLF